MRIGYVHVDYEEWTDGSYNVQEIGLAKAFEELGHETVIVYWVKPKSPKCFTEKEITDKIKKVYLPTLHFRHHVIYNCNYLKKLKFDLIHIQSDNLFYVPQVAGWCRRNHIPHYCYVGTIESSNPSKVQKTLMDLLVKRNIRTYKKETVFTKTAATAEQLKKYGVKSPIVAPVGLDTSIIPEIPENKEQLRDEFGFSKEKKLVVCVCAIRPSKHPFDIFELVDYLDDCCEVLYIGGPPQNEFNECVKKASKKVSFKYISGVPNAEIHRYYRCADYFVNFNPEEIFGMAILEAMYQNCTVVARHAPGPDYIIVNGKSGYLVNSVREMAEIILEGKNCAENAKKRVEDAFLWHGTAVEMLKSVEKRE